MRRAGGATTPARTSIGSGPNSPSAPATATTRWSTDAMRARIETTAAFQARSMQGRTLAPGDVYSLLVENNGAGGYYTELSRIFIFAGTRDGWSERVRVFLKKARRTDSSCGVGSRDKTKRVS